jgi:Kelch motif protein
MSSLSQPASWVTIAVLLSPGSAALSQDGAWDAPFSLPLISIHSAVLPSGKVLLFSAEHGVPGIHGWLLDPQSLALTEVAPPSPWNPDCAGHSFLPDGRLLVAGGTVSFNPLTGTQVAYLFDPYLESWTSIEDMAAGRWYPTNLTLQDGSVLTMAGLSEVPGVDNTDIERWDPSGVANWQVIGQKVLPYYPYLHLLPDGLVLKTGPDPATETYDPATNTWTPVATTNFPGRFEAPSVQLPPGMDRFMLVGGFTGSGQPTPSVEIIDMSAPVPSWSTTAHMASPRLEHNAVILPDGQVIVLGGRADNDPSPTPVLIPEIFDPVAEVWDPVAPHAIPRMYHATAVLLPDGRVLLAGGDFQASGEIYSPP